MKILEIYVAGKFEEKDLILETYRELKQIGHKVAYDWTKHKLIKPYSENQEIARTYSENELQGISNSDVFIYLSCEKGTTLPMEFGAALTSSLIKGKPLIYAVGKFNTKSPWFFNKRVIRKESIKEVINELKNLK